MLLRAYSLPLCQVIRLEVNFILRVCFPGNLDQDRSAWGKHYHSNLKCVGGLLEHEELNSFSMKDDTRQKL